MANINYYPDTETPYSPYKNYPKFANRLYCSEKGNHAA